MPEWPFSIEEFRTLLIDVSRNASHTVETGDDPEDARRMWHAAEIALALLDHEYQPRFETLEDVRALVTRSYRTRG